MILDSCCNGLGIAHDAAKVTANKLNRITNYFSFFLKPNCVSLLDVSVKAFRGPPVSNLNELRAMLCEKTNSP
jgi:hypothetical protein